MKKIVSLLLVLMLAMGMVAGCTGKDKKGEKNLPANNVQDENNNQEKSKFEEKDGILVYTDVENGPFEESGLKISIKKGDDGYVEFIKTDLEGNETVDYYKFDYSTNTVEKYYYVSAMGTAFYYYYDLEKNELDKVEDGDHNDNTEKMKSSGRWDSAAEKTKEEVSILEDYFKEQYSMTIKEAVLGK
jgi:predicted small lipoprotein YifL